MLPSPIQARSRVKVTKAYLDLCDLVRLCPIPSASLSRIFGDVSERTAERRFQAARREGHNHGVTLIKEQEGKRGIWYVFVSGTLKAPPVGVPTRYKTTRKKTLSHNGMCVDCKRDSEPGRLRCRSCAKKTSKSNLKARKRRVRRGNCRECSDKVSPERVLCDIHLRAARERWHKHKEVTNKKRREKRRKGGSSHLAQEG